MDYTGTGNTLNAVHPSVLRLIMDSLRYWVIECHVDGFRFDLASALARELYDVDRLSAFFDTIHQDPVLSQVKLIAEPWDVGPGGYQVGNFPVLWIEWNGIYRDVDARLLARRRRASPSSPRASPARATSTRTTAASPFASINFITAHDGFTLARPRLLQREAQRGQPRGQPRRHRRQPLLELRRRGRRPTTPRSTSCAPASSATSSPRCCSPRACRCCSAATSSAAPRAATTTPGARTPRSPGSTGSLDDGRSELLEFTRG